MHAAAVMPAEDITMDDHQVYLAKMSAFSRMLRLEGILVGPSETADACRILTALGMEDRNAVKQALSAIYAKSKEEQLIFSRVFDGFFVNEETMRAQAKEQALREAEMDALKKQADEELRYQDRPILNEDQRATYAAMPEEERERLLQFLDKYKSTAERSPELYGNFIHSVFAKSLLEQQMRMEDAAASAAAADPEIGLLFRDITDFKDTEIPRAISMIQTIAQRINAELTARKKSSGRSRVLDFRRTIRKGLETGGTFYRLKYKKKPRRRRHMVLLCDVSGSMIQFSEFALRFIQSLNQSSESSRTFLFSETVAEADAFSLQNMDLFRDYIGRTGIYGKGTNLGAALEHLCAFRPPILTDSTTLIILSDTKTVEQARAFHALQEAKHLCGKVIWLNPIPEHRWSYLKSTQIMASSCTMLPCSTLNELAQACRKITARE